MRARRQIVKYGDSIGGGVRRCKLRIVCCSVDGDASSGDGAARRVGDTNAEIGGQRQSRQKQRQKKKGIPHGNPRVHASGIGLCSSRRSPGSQVSAYSTPETPFPSRWAEQWFLDLLDSLTVARQRGIYTRFPDPAAKRDRAICLD